MRYESKRGNFVSFDKVGMVIEGTFAGVRKAPSQYGGDDRVIDLQTSEGKKAIRLNIAAIGSQWAEAESNEPVRQGERLRFTYDGNYDSKKFGKGRGKDIAIDFLDRGGDAPEGDDDVGVAYAELVKAKGEKDAKSIKKAVEQVAKKDPAKQAELLRKAVAA